MTGTEPLLQRARTKIVATLGPASREEAVLTRLVAAGVDVFRLNLAHATLNEHTETIARIRRVASAAERPVAVLADLAGPKIRLGELPGGSLDLLPDSECRFVRTATDQPGDLTVTYPPLLDEVRIGDSIMLADGVVSLVVYAVTADEARCRVVQPGLIRSRQGVNLPGVKLGVAALTDEDRRHAEWAALTDLDFVGMSFVRTPDEVRELKSHLAPLNRHIQVVAKIEKREALDRLDDIIAAADAVMVARGDLGIETDISNIAIVQKRIIATAHRWGRPVITATQMLDSMQSSRRPTRAEATDVANAILDGADACMLSGETAIGSYPVETIQMMNRIMLATERYLSERPLSINIPREDVSATSVVDPEAVHPITAAVVRAATQVAVSVGAKLVIVSSHTGKTALALSQQRSVVPTVGSSDVQAILRKMCLYWGVIPLPQLPSNNREALVSAAETWAKHDGLLARGDSVVVVGGHPGAIGPHNMIEVHQVE